MSQLELNTGDNFIFAMDVSASMGAMDCPGDMSRIEYCKEQAKTFAREAGGWDEDGIDVITFGHQVKVFANVTTDKAEELIGALKANEMSTDTAGAIRAAYKRHKETGSKQTFVFFVTDGEPNDRAAVMKAIVDITNEIEDEHEFALQILTVGKIEPQLGAFLAALDDELKGAKFDIVDVKALESVNFVEACAGALHD